MPLQNHYNADFIVTQVTQVMDARLYNKTKHNLS